MLIAIILIKNGETQKNTLLPFIFFRDRMNDVDNRAGGEGFAKY
jgi:hypothetical protein